MAIESTPPIFNPAAAVNTVSRNTGTGGAPSGASQESNQRNGTQRNEAVKVEISPQISQVSRSRAAAGDTALSAETMAAIASGKQAPQIIPQAEIPRESIVAAEQTSELQQNQADNTQNITQAESTAALANAANIVATITPTIPSNFEGLSSPSSSNTGGSAPAPTQDTATAALGNTADITV